jgi:hypothetical protein
LDARATTRIVPFTVGHCVAYGLVCIVLPLLSWAGDGRCGLAFTMYSSTVTYRVEMAWLDDRGLRHGLAPTVVARNVSFDSAAPFLAGAEVFRTVPQIDALRGHLREVARAACPLRPARVIEITLHEHGDLGEGKTGAPDLCATERITCARSE